MSITTDQRDKLAKALKEALGLLEERRDRIKGRAVAYAEMEEACTEEEQNWEDFILDMDEEEAYHEINNFIEKWKS